MEKDEFYTKELIQKFFCLLLIVNSGDGRYNLLEEVKSFITKRINDADKKIIFSRFITVLNEDVKQIVRSIEIGGHSIFGLKNELNELHGDIEESFKLIKAGEGKYRNNDFYDILEYGFLFIRLKLNREKMSELVNCAIEVADKRNDFYRRAIYLFQLGLLKIEYEDYELAIDSLIDAYSCLKETTDDGKNVVLKQRIITTIDLCRFWLPKEQMI